MTRLAKATGATVINTVNNASEDILGTCGYF